LGKSLNILICPLEWGLGHAGRMLPLARKFKEQGHRVIIASGNEHLAFFKTEIPDLEFVCFTGFKPGYSRILPQYLHLLLRVPVLFWHILKEHIRIKKLIDKESVDILISDNRFGLWNKNITTVYITHMPRIPFPAGFRFLESAGIFLHGLVIKRYSFCYIPDLPGDVNLSGRLSHGLKLSENVTFIGILSRFSAPEMNNNRSHNLVILSGPEPQKSILKDKIINALKKDEMQTIILEGKPGENASANNKANMISHRHLSTDKMKEEIQNSRVIITRSGYTTLMELVSLNRSAYVVPTPGQTEQEYLADYMSELGWFVSLLQKDIREGTEFIENELIDHAHIVDQSNLLLNDALDRLYYYHQNRQSKESGH
jgi:spore coat polysaccharide biosynthesis predicted glycosyltransferase SpsG